MLGFSEELLLLVAVAVPVTIVSITLHEAAHGFVAWRLGDTSALAAGRITVNPIRHVDFLGTIVLPTVFLLSGARFMFGWTKPVPVDPMAFARPRRDVVLVALAGPGVNLLLALLFGAALALYGGPSGPHDALHMMLSSGIYLNALFAVFNLLPVPPLDGGRIAIALAPERVARRLLRTERYGLWVLIGALIVPALVGRVIGVDLDLFRRSLLPLVEGVVSVVEFLTDADVVWRWW